MLYLQCDSTPNEKDPPLISSKLWPRPHFPSMCTTCPTSTLSESSEMMHHGQGKEEEEEERKRERETLPL